MTTALATGDHVIVLATGEVGFVTGSYLPGMDVRVLLPNGRFAVLHSAEVAPEVASAAPVAGDLHD
jgi:hypothetical protein